jgi:acetyl-CoA carboxylase biotin carboxyl carrier protein
MEITSEEVLAVLRVLRESDVEVLDIRLGELELHASKSVGDHHLNGTGTSATRVVEETRVRDASTRQPVEVPENTRPVALAAPPEGDAELVEVSAPILGIYYTASGPDAVPYVTVGSTVREDTTVGLIEVMKSFSSVLAGVRGTVRDILAKNGELVEYGETLVLIEPEQGRQ